MVDAADWGPDPACNLWGDIRPGDLFWDTGGGLVGAIIGYGSRSPFAHCGVFVRRLSAIRDASGHDVDDLWETHEAYPRKLQIRKRRASSVHGVLRLWSNEREQAAILERSHAMVGLDYAFGELARIILWRLRQYRLHLLVPVAAFSLLQWYVPAAVAWLLAIASWWPYPEADNPRTAICSNHVAAVVGAARPGVLPYATVPDPSGQLTRVPDQIWPGRVFRDLFLIAHNDRARFTGTS